MQAAQLDPGQVRDWLWTFVNQTQEHAVLLLDERGRVGWANPGAETILDAPDLVGEPVDRFFTAEDIRGGVPTFEKQMAKARGSADDDRWMRRRDGSQFWASGTTVALHHPDGALFGFLKMFRNRTVNKMRMQSMRNRVQDQAQRVEQSSTAVAMVAHELRTPLSNLHNAITLLRMLPEGDVRREDVFFKLDANLALCRRMVDDLTDATRAQAGKLRVESVACSLGALLKDAIDAARIHSASPGRTIDLILPEHDVQVQGDPARLMQVFTNLIGNAIRYTGEEGKIWVSAVSEHTEAVIKVEDCGIGIPREMLGAIFDMFTQGSNTSADQGLGIGLALVKHLVELHGGSIQAQSEGPGKGSQFYVRLPLSNPD
jgi:two-component system CheB/CheR fusion protein